ncbi:hypothetical protein H8E88_30020 [candidate division KSB1 bacterium]|nr:hypothetical protein [candidate division KSB1 bacterium]
MKFEQCSNRKSYMSYSSEGLLCAPQLEKPTTANEVKYLNLFPDQKNKSKKVEQETKILDSAHKPGFFASTKNALGMGRIVCIFLMVAAEFGFLLDYQKIFIYPQLLFIIGLVGLLFGDDIEKNMRIKNWINK